MYFKEKLIKALNLTEDEFNSLSRDVTINDIESPSNFKDIDIAVARIKKSIENKEKIMIYGDYDCDGICSVSILVKTFNLLNYPVGYYVPSRYKDGYGINENMIDIIHKKGYKLIITVDNGVSQIDAIKRANEYGIDVIVTDHHEILRGLPDCYCLVHPFHKIENEMAQCGAYVSFMLSIKLLNHIDKYLLVLASLATISDLMPLVGPNRILVKEGINILQEEKIPQIKMLVDSDDIDEKILGFSLAPKINAVGRVKEDMSVNNVVKFFTSVDTSEQIKFANYINSINDMRKSMCLDAYNNLNLDSYKDDLVIVCYIPNLREGLIGLVAARILSMSNKPTVVFTKSENGLLKGSARSLNGFSLADAFTNLANLIEVFGGHALAGGLTIKEENLDRFKIEINKLALGKEIKMKDKILIQMEKDDFSYENYLLFKKIGPFGEGFEEPQFEYRIKTAQISFIGNMKQHIRGIINNECSFIHFNVDKSKLVNDEITLIGRIELDKYRNNHSLSFVVSQII